MKHKLIIAFLIWLFPLNAFTQKISRSSFIKDSLDIYIKKGINEWEIPGLSIAIIKDGALVFNKGYGTKKIGTDSPVDSNTIFMIGSLSKAITCATTVLATQNSTLQLNDPIVKWLPEFSLKGQSDNKSILVEDILTGRTGLGSHRGDFLFWKTKLDPSHLLSILKEIAPESEVRRKFIYNNISYLLLDTILTKVNGKSWSTSVKNTFFKPLEMDYSYTSVAKIPIIRQGNLATPHLKHQSKIIPIEVENIINLGPAGSIVSTSTDMSKWILEFINREGIFPNDVKKVIRKPYQLIGYRTEKAYRDQLRFLFSGMGWNIFDEFDQLTYVHDGGTDGFKSYLMIIPEAQFGVIVLTNSRSHNFAEALVNELQYALVNEPFQNFSEDALLDFIEENKTELTKENEINTLIQKNASIPILSKQYVGTYFNPLYGNLDIVEEDGQLQLKLLQHQNNLTGTLNFIGDATFWSTFSSPEFYSTKIIFSWKKNKIDGLTFVAAPSGDENYWFERKNQ